MGERDDGQIKLHRRTVVLDRTQRTVMSPRPADGHRWATNRYHDDWHILSDHDGGGRLGRLLWIMAAQEPGTLLVIDQSCLVPNPFDADPSTPIVIANHGDGLGSFALWCEQARLIREELFPGRSRSPLTEDERRRVWERLPPRQRV